MLAYKHKLEASGGALIKVAPQGTSQTCSDCRIRNSDSRKSQARFVCEHCGATHNADINAAANIFDRALERALAPPG